MRVAFVMFDRMRLHDFSSFYEYFTREGEDVVCRFYALKDEIKDDKGLILKPDCVGESLDGNDLVFVPGGAGAEIFYKDEIFLAWIKTSRFAKYKVSVNEGTLLLGGAGFLNECDICAKTELEEILKPMCKSIKNEDFVQDKSIFTCKDGFDKFGLFVARHL